MITTQLQSRKPVEGSEPINSESVASASSRKSSKKSKYADPESSTGPIRTDNATVDKFLGQTEESPLDFLKLNAPLKPEPETTFAHLLNAMLSSARISHAIAAETLAIVVKAGYNNFDTLRQSSWQQRNKVLTEGNSTRYREKTTTAPGELAQLLD